MPACPFCSSEMVYPLLDTLRCKRCKNIWKVEDLDPSAAFQSEGKSLGIRTRAPPLEKRMEMRLDECLARSGGKFCITTMSWQAGDISPELFKRYLRQCVKDRTLTETKDHYGRTWYSKTR
ncbi:MAG: hypothetical protein WC586_05640 [Methanoregula sp.]